MVRHIHVLIVLAIISTPLVTDAAEPIPMGRQLFIQVRSLEGDPQGSIEQGTIKVIAEPNLITIAGRSALFNAGGEVSLVERPTSNVDYVRIGTTVDCKTGQVHDGMVRLDLNMTTSDVIDRSAKPIAVQRECIRAIIDAKLAEKITIGKPTPGVRRQRWYEITVHELKSTEEATKLLNEQR